MTDDPNKVLDVPDVSRVTTDLPRSVKVAIADSIIALSRMEVAAESLIWALTGMDPATGRLLTAMDARPKFSVTRTLLTRKIPKLTSQTLPADFWEKLSELRDCRNEIVHGVWVMLDNSIPFAISYRTKDHRGVIGSAYARDRLAAIASMADIMGRHFDRLEDAFRAQQEASRAQPVSPK